MIEDLTSGPVPTGSILLVEYDAASQWYNASITMTAGWLRTGGKADFGTFTQPPNDVRAQMKRLGLEPEVLEREGRLIITDWYTATLGQKSNEKESHESLKISDLSIHFAQTLFRGEPEPDMITTADDESTFARFNDEKTWMELELTRVIPGVKRRRITSLFPVMNGVHSEWVYKRWEGVSDVIIDFKVDACGDEVRNLMRIRLMRNVHFDSQWHALKISKNFEVTLEK